MNCIVLEGFSLYVTLILILLLVLISLGSLCCAIFADRRNFVMRCVIKKLIIENKLLNKANIILKIKYGEFDINER